MRGEQALVCHRARQGGRLIFLRTTLRLDWRSGGSVWRPGRQHGTDHDDDT